MTKGFGLNKALNVQILRWENSPHLFSFYQMWSIAEKGLKCTIDEIRRPRLGKFATKIVIEANLTQL